MAFLRGSHLHVLFAILAAFSHISDASDNFAMTSADSGTLVYRPYEGSADSTDMCSTFYNLQTHTGYPIVLTLERVPAESTISVYDAGCGATSIYMAQRYFDTDQGTIIPIADSKCTIMMSLPCSKTKEHMIVSWHSDTTLPVQEPDGVEKGWTNVKEGSTSWDYPLSKKSAFYVPPMDGRIITVETINDGADEANWWETDSTFHCELVQVFPQGCKRVFTNDNGLSSTYTTVMKGANTFVYLMSEHAVGANPAPKLTLKWERPPTP